MQTAYLIKMSVLQFIEKGNKCKRENMVVYSDGYLLAQGRIINVISYWMGKNIIKLHMKILKKTGSKKGFNKPMEK